MKKLAYKLAVILSAMSSVDAFAQESLVTESRAVALTLMQQLGAELKKELAAGGPDAAIKVCKTIAPDLATKLSIEKGWRVTRVSLKVRNALLGMPDVWEQQVLQTFDTRAAAGEPADKLEFSEIVSEPTGRFFRYAKALPVQPLCVTCHGSAEQILDSVKATLAQIYPHDRAIGYMLGQVRGAISIKRAIPE